MWDLIFLNKTFERNRSMGTRQYEERRISSKELFFTKKPFTAESKRTIAENISKIVTILILG